MIRRALLTLAFIGLSAPAALACPGSGGDCDCGHAEKPAPKGPMMGRGKGPGGGGHGKLMRHVNPLPNFMRVVVHKNAALKLNVEQQKAFAEWRGANHDKSMKLAKGIAHAEMKLAEAAKGGDDAKALKLRYAEIAKQRAELFELKLNCREMLKTQLTPEQWATVVKLDGEMNAHRGPRKGPGPHAHKHGAKGEKPCDGEKKGDTPCDCEK